MRVWYRSSVLREVMKILKRVITLWPKHSRLSDYQLWTLNGRTMWDGTEQKRTSLPMGKRTIRVLEILACTKR
jgi:hypothetical protein